MPIFFCILTRGICHERVSPSKYEASTIWLIPPQSPEVQNVHLRSWHSPTHPPTDRPTPIPAGLLSPPHAQSKTLLDLMKSKHSPRLDTSSGRQTTLSSFAKAGGGDGGGSGGSRANGRGGGRGCDDDSDDDRMETDECDDSQ